MRHIRGSHSSGQGLAEFALILPILALLLGAVIQFAFVLETQMGVTNAVREAARRAAATPTDATNVSTNAAWARNQLLALMPAHVQAYSSSNVTSSSVCYATVTDPGGASKLDVTVSATYGHPLFIPLVAQFLDAVDGTANGRADLATSVEMEVQESTGGASGCSP